MKRKIKDVIFNTLDRFAENYSLSVSNSERSRTDDAAYATIDDAVEDKVTKKQFRNYYETAKWEKMNGTLLIIFLLVFSIGLVSASSVSVWQGQYYTGTTFNTGTYVFNFTVYDSLTGGDSCFSNATNLTTGNWGEWKTEQVRVGDSCDNSSEEYFLNINIDEADQSPRRRLVIWDFLRRDVEEVKDGNLVVSDNITAGYYFGDGSSLTNLAAGSLGVSINTTEIENGQVWTADVADGNITDVKIFNLSWGKLVFVPSGLADGDNDTTYSHLTNFTDDILWTSVFNSTGDSRWNGSIDTQKNTSGNYLYNDSATIYFNESRLNLTIESFNYLTSYVETDPLWSANFSLYNSSWSLDTQKGTSGNYLYNDSFLIYFNDTLLNDTIDIRSDGGTYLNLSGTNADQDINVTPYNFETSNLSLTQKITFALGEIVDNVVGGWVRITGGLNVTGNAIVQGNVTVEGIFLEQDSVNHSIYDNSSCVIIKGDTSTMYIC